VTHLNLMTSCAQCRLKIRRAARLWISIWLLTAAVLSVFAYGEWRATEDAARRKESLQRRHQPIARVTALTADRQQQMRELRLREAAALHLAEPRSVLGLVGAVSAAAEHAEKRVHVKQFDFTDAEAFASNPASPGALRLTGCGSDDAAVARFVEHLRTLKPFVAVELKGTQARRSGELVVRDFQIECALE
jgi:hypothetical protein